MRADATCAKGTSTVFVCLLVSAPEKDLAAPGLFCVVSLSAVLRVEGERVGLNGVNHSTGAIVQASCNGFLLVFDVGTILVKLRRRADGVLASLSPLLPLLSGRRQVS